MRFIANICHRDATLARVSIDDRSAETLGQNALRARNTLIRDANRHRSENLSDAVLDQMAEIYGHVVASQIISREGRSVTCVARGDQVTQMEGMITLLTGPKDLVMLIEVWSDAKVAESRAFVESVLSPAA